MSRRLPLAIDARRHRNDEPDVMAKFPERFEFSKVRALVVDADRHASSISSQLLRGFGVHHIHTATTGEHAQKLLAETAYQLVLTDAVLPDMSGGNLIRWMRRQREEEIKFAPIIVLSGYTQFENVTNVRDCGVNSVVKKPVSPAVLLDHILWTAKTHRPFVESERYVGPDRRFKFKGPPSPKGRRDEDPQIEVELRSDDDAPQDDIDSSANQKAAQLS
jgi:CheY-like chemotaxis protein